MWLLMTFNEKTRLLMVNVLFTILLWTKYCYGYCKIINSIADCSNKNLTSVPQDLDPNITTLNLTENQLQRLYNKSFGNYTLLKQLLINNNVRLSSIEEDAFYGLKDLLYLSLKGNNLTHRSYPKYVFQPLSKLERLDLSNNSFSLKITDPTYYPYFGDLKNLTELHLDLLSNAYFNESGFNNTKQLTVLKFPNCALTDMNNNSFQGIALSVKSLNLKMCLRVMHVQLDFLSPFPKLENLTLHHSNMNLSNALSLLYPFRNKQLKLIDFNRVSPTHQDSVIVTKKMMEYLTTICVENLFLTDSGIVDFEEGSLLNYTYPECFRMMVFTGNRFSISSTKKKRDLMNLFHNMTNLKLFDFSYIPLNFINISYINPQKPYFDFETRITQENYNQGQSLMKNPKLGYSWSMNRSFYLPPKIQTLRMSHFLGSFEDQENMIIRNGSSLLHLDMSYLQLISVPNIYFDGPNNIKYVDFSGIDAKLYCQKDKIVNFENATCVILRNAKLNFVASKIHIIFRKFPNVQKLDLSWNNLWYLPCDSFSENMHIKQLILIGNSFFDIPIAIKYLSYLEFFDVPYNYLRNINESFTNWFDQQQMKTETFKLKFLDNGIKCTCSNTDFIEWLFKTKVNIVDSHKLTCSLENGTMAYAKHVHRCFHELFKTKLRLNLFSEAI